MDGNRSDEDMPKPKRTKRKSKRQTNDIEKPTRKHKKAFVKPDSVVENSPKKKFPHATRRRRRDLHMNKVLLQTPEDEIDLRQISIRDLIMLAEAKERIARKETAAMSKLFSGQSYEKYLTGLQHRMFHFLGFRLFIYRDLMPQILDI
ncbi:unnamed protein product [Musa acuminata subsp. malaccensis]|uniref:(wild Malaysian banana) hypothetical protein n=1 Tax=Musa acuminata subsp. malaccensis TaxID=214687 RepID=A0A804LBR7_MUSAM|nr:unnamed protein product [Musa acuminata subsp. malaccensis]